eukprot:3998676-Amphidinium_carterae.1
MAPPKASVSSAAAADVSKAKLQTPVASAKSTAPQPSVGQTPAPQPTTPIHEDALESMLHDL